MAGRVLAVWGDEAVARAGGRLARWLVEEACPRAAAGRVGGLFADGAPFGVAVQGEMVSAFILAGRLGWRGPWAGLAGQTLDGVLARGDGADEGSLRSMARALTMGAQALGRADWRDAARDLRGRMMRAGLALATPEHGAVARVLDARNAAEALAGVEAFDLATMRGGDLWPVARVACALLTPEDRLWLYP